MGPEEHGGHCELEFDGLESRATKTCCWASATGSRSRRSGSARRASRTACAGSGSRSASLAIALDYVAVRESGGRKLADLDSVREQLGDAAMQIEIGRLLTMRAARKLDAGDFARKEISMAKVVVADALQQAADTGSSCAARAATRRTRCSSGSTAMRGRRGSSTARRRCTTACWRGS